MELRHLHSFLAIADELHFGRAARRLHLAQPSLSQQLQRLEQSLGVQLVARSSHEVRLTPAGVAFEVEARAVLERVDRARDAARRAAEGRTGTVHVGYNLPAALAVLPRVLARVHAELPEVVVAPREMWTGPQLRALHDGRLDVGLVYGRPSSTSLGHRRLLRMPLVALVGRRHPWASRARVPFAELAHQQALLFPRDLSPAMHDLVTRTARAEGFVLDVVDQVEDPVATASVVCTRDVVGFASAARAAAVCGAATGIRPVAVPLVDPVPVLELYAAWRSDLHQPLVEAFLRCLREVGPFDGAGPRGEPARALGA